MKPEWCPDDIWKRAQYYWRLDGCSAPTPNTYARALLTARQQGRDEGLEEAKAIASGFMDKISAEDFAAAIREKIGEHGNG